MEMMNILIPTDFSPEAENAKAFASSMAKLTEGRISFLYALPPIYDFAAIADAKRDSSLKVAGSFLKRYVKELGNLGVHSSYRIVEEDLERAVDLAVDEMGIDLVVVGTKGAKGMKKLLLGSNANTILQRVDVPVLIVPAGIKFEQVREIVIAVEHPDQALEVVERVIQLTGQWNLSYEILHVATEVDLDIIETRRRHVPKLEKKFPGKVFGFSEILSLDVQQGLKRFQDEHPEILLVMYAHHACFKDLFHRSETKEMAYHTNCPMLVIKENGGEDPQKEE